MYMSNAHTKEFEMANMTHARYNCLDCGKPTVNYALSAKRLCLDCSMIRKQAALIPTISQLETVEIIRAAMQEQEDRFDEDRRLKVTVKGPLDCNVAFANKDQWSFSRYFAPAPRSGDNHGGMALGITAHIEADGMISELSYCEYSPHDFEIVQAALNSKLQEGA